MHPQTTTLSLLGIAALFLASLTSISAQEKAMHEVKPSPDGRHIIGWFDHEPGAPFGPVRVIMVRSVPEMSDIFSLVSTPRATDAAWSADSTQCVIADAPDNGGPRVWLIAQKASAAGAAEWTSREISPFASLEEAFYKSSTKSLFRPSILKITWLSKTQVCFRGYCNTGTYLMTVNTDKPEHLPKIEKLSDNWLEEK